MFSNLPKICEENSTNKILKTEQAINPRIQKKYLTIKNDIMKNNNIRNKKNKNRSGNSLDMKLVYKKQRSPLKFNNFTRNITFDALKNKEINLKKDKKNNNETINKSGETMKYLNTNPNININIKNNINIFFELKDKEKNKKSINCKNTNNNMEINIFKNSNYILNNNGVNRTKQNNMKQKDKNNTENKNNINVIKIIKNENEINKGKKTESAKGDKILSFEKNISKDLFNNNNNIINAKGKNFVFTKYNKKFVNAKDLFSMRKEIFSNQRLPRLKLKLNKK